MHEITINTKNASREIIGNAVAYDKQDKKILKTIYNKWMELNEQIGMLQGRRVMIPGELIEGIVCLHCDMWKVTNAIARSFDLWDPNAKEDKNRVDVYATTSAVFQMLLSERLRNSTDRVLFMKLYVSKGDSLKYEIYDFDIEQILNLANSRYMGGRTIIKFEDLKDIPYNNIYIGEL